MLLLNWSIYFSMLLNITIIKIVRFIKLWFLLLSKYNMPIKLKLHWILEFDHVGINSGVLFYEINYNYLITYSNLLAKSQHVCKIIVRFNFFSSFGVQIKFD